jgi:HPt (histidine-containing phosphotransfer) domain-containing protein
MAKVELELQRIAQLQEVMGAQLGEIIEGIVQSISTAIAQLEEALRAGELDRAAKAAHACRNDALMVGAKQLLVALTEIENCARNGQAPRAHRALLAVRETWPVTREELERVASGD